MDVSAKLALRTTWSSYPLRPSVKNPTAVLRQLIPNALGQVLTPSAVSVVGTGEIVVGLAGLERLSTHPRRSVAAFKRFMGTNRVVTLGDRDFRP